MRNLLIISAIAIILLTTTNANADVNDTAGINKIKPLYLSQEEIVQRLNLPKEITIEEANSSVLGPLTDDNIRKDLKRMIGLAAPKDTSTDAKTRAVFYRLSQIWTEMIQNQDDKEKLIDLDYERTVIWACVINNYVEKPDDLKVFLTELTNGSIEKAIVYDKINEQLDANFGIIPANIYQPKCDSL